MNDPPQQQDESHSQPALPLPQALKDCIQGKITAGDEAKGWPLQLTCLVNTDKALRSTDCRLHQGLHMHSLCKRLHHKKIHTSRFNSKPLQASQLLLLAGILVICSLP